MESINVLELHTRILCKYLAHCSYFAFCPQRKLWKRNGPKFIKLNYARDVKPCIIRLSKRHMNALTLMSIWVQNDPECACISASEFKQITIVSSTKLYQSAAETRTNRPGGLGQ